MLKYARYLRRPRRALDVLRNRWKSRQFDRFYDAVLDVVEGGSMTVRLDAFEGVFEVDVRSHLLRRILMWKAYEPELAALVRRHLDPQRDALDVGANVGFYTVLMARLVAPPRRVLAVEPAPLPQGYLQRNLRRNGCEEQVEVFHGLATAEVGTYRLHVVPGLEEYASLGTPHRAVQHHDRHSVEVPGRTLDQLVAEGGYEPGFVKIDTEGAERAVLSGASETLRRFRPVILSELSDPLLAAQGASAAEVVRLLEAHGYAVVDAATGGPVTYPFDGDVLARPLP